MTITSINNPEYLLIRSVGNLKNETDLFEHASLIYNEFKKYDNKKILIDALTTTFPHDLFPYYDLVQYYTNNFPPEIRELKVACIISPDFAKAGEFWQTVSNNSGFQYHAFTSVREAEEWLMSTNSL